MRIFLVILLSVICAANVEAKTKKSPWLTASDMRASCDAYGKDVRPGTGGPTNPLLCGLVASKAEYWSAHRSAAMDDEIPPFCMPRTKMTAEERTKTMARAFVTYYDQNAGSLSEDGEKAFFAAMPKIWKC